MMGGDELSVYSITLFVSLLCASVVISHLFEKNRWINESFTALIIGLSTGTILLVASAGKSSRIMVFNEELFFIYLLPPIIFNAGFQVQKRLLFRNFIRISVFGAIGTLISFGIIALGSSWLFKNLDIGFMEMRDYLALGAIFSATDSICTLQVLSQDETPLLYGLVFGEGVVNDATSIVLFNAIKIFDLSHITPAIVMDFIGNFMSLFTLSTLLGIAAGLISAFVIKRLSFGRLSTDREISLMTLMAYLSYIMADLFDLSGILTVFICGIVMSHYTWHVVTNSSKVTTRHAFATMSYVSEIFLFLYVGMDALDIEKWKFVSESPGTSAGVSLSILGLVILGRAAFIFPLAVITNLLTKSQHDKVSFREQVTIWWAGLMRGAVSVALAYNQFTRSGHTQQKGNAIMITSTITIVLFSTLVVGLLTKPLIRLLVPKGKQFTGMELPESACPKDFTDPLIANGQENPEAGIIGSTSLRTNLRMHWRSPTYLVHYYWQSFDNAFMRPVFGGKEFESNDPESPTAGSSH